MRRLVPLLFALVVVGCGGSGSAPDEGSEDSTEGSGGDRPGDEGGARPAPTRALGMTASFGDLVAAAQALEDAGAADSTAACLLGGAGPYRLEADIAVAIRPLPETPEDLDARLESAGAASVLSRWGQLGPGDLALAVFTTAPRARNAAAIAITDRGIRVLPVGPGPSARGGDAVASAQLAAAAIPSGTALAVVTGERGVPLSRVREVLAAVAGHAGAVAIAVALPDGVRLPEVVRPADDGTGMCASGLPPLADAAAGELSPQAIVGALAPLRDGARSCLEAARGEAAAGGRVAIAMRIGPNGILTDACLTEDAIGDLELRTCLIRAARAVAFPAPDPAGSVDAVLPLELRPETPREIRAVCD